MVFFLVYYLRFYVYNESNHQPKGENMKLKSFVLGAAVLALAACGDNAQNPDLLKGAKFVSEQPDVTITLEFAPEEMRVNGKVVNLYNGAYTVDGDKIQFEGFASTMMMGEPAAMEIEQEYFQFMPTVQTYEFTDGKLVLTGTDGKEIVFTQIEETPAEAPAEAAAEPAAE